MPNSEQSKIDRANKAHILLTALKGFVPVYTSADSDLSIPNFTAFLVLVDAANEEVENTKSFFSLAVEKRRLDSSAAQLLTTQVINYVASNKAWKADLPRIKELANQVREIKPPRKTTPPPAPQPGQPAPAEEKPRDRGNGSYAEIAVRFKALGAKVATLPGYAPDDDDIKAPALATLAAQLAANNDAVETTDSDLDKAQRRRHELFDTPETGLADKFQAIKKAVKGQYGQSSTQFAQVKGIKW